MIIEVSVYSTTSEPWSDSNRSVDTYSQVLRPHQALTCDFLTLLQ